MIVATHKPYAIPEEKPYLPVQAGAACHERLAYQGDDTGENISAKNDLYCELTALYWAWKNVPADALGLCHYRRYFWDPASRRPVGEAELQALLNSAPVLLPKKRHYWIETGESQFVHAHGQASLDLLRTVVRELEPEYLPALERSLRKTAGHRFNMFVMRREQLDAYCAWLFSLLFETERRMAAPEPRILGFLAERLMDAWVETTGVAFRELPVHYTEKVNWLKKGGAFLLRKLRG